MAEPSEYRATLNLPRTEFPMKADLVKREPEFLKRWENVKLYERLRAARKGPNVFVFHDGPPFSNGNAHLGHLLNNILKDAVVRYKFARGFDVPFTPGWDCHGQPTEMQYLKTSGLNPRDVDPLELRRACAAYALKWVNVQREQRKRTGALGDWDRPYLTMDRSFEAAEIEAVGRLILDGFIFRGKKPVYWCPSCETAQAENSVEYGPHVAPSIYVRFRVKSWPDGRTPAGLPGAKPVAAVVWTTTPWTLPANVALAFNPRFTYEAWDVGAEVLLAAKELVPAVLGLAKLPGRPVATVRGADLEGVVCEHPFLPRTSVGVLADYVTLEAGSGIVHTAPGHGEEDYRTGIEYRLPVLAPVDGRGRFTAEFPEFEGQPVFEANPGIVALLKARGALLHEGVLEHSYPFCWRCKNPVIFRATEQWFISLEHAQLKRRAVEAARAVTWYPPAGADRMASMIDQRPDWCISRQRAWGLPIPVFYCTACGQVLATEASLHAVRDWVAQEGADVWWMKDADTLLPAGTRCHGCGGRKFRKETDTLDPWFDSGVTHTAVLKTRPDLRFPADLYLEAGDQFRGWFQSSLLTSVALNGAAPYRSVVVHGWVLDPKGQKMSKSLGNVVSLEDAVNRWGADVMRLWGLSEHFHDDMLLQQEAMDRIVEAYRKIRNTLRFLLGNVADYHAAPPERRAEAPRAVDHWMAWRCDVLVREVTADLDRYAFHHAFQKLYRFCVVELSAFYLDLLKDRLYASAADDPARRAAQRVLAGILDTLQRLLAPYLPFTCEDVWTHLPESVRDGVVSVHLLPWPEAPGQDHQVHAAHWDAALRLRDAVQKEVELARQAKRVDNPLETRIVLAGGGHWERFLAERADELAELLTASQASVEAYPAGAPATVTTPEGPLLVRVERPAGKKCARCWLVKAEVGTVPAAPALCGRCASVLAGAR